MKKENITGFIVPFLKTNQKLDKQMKTLNYFCKIPQNIFIPEGDLLVKKSTYFFVLLMCKSG